MRILILLILFISAGCQTEGGGAGGEGLFNNHLPVENKFTLTTTLSKTYVATETITFTLSFPTAVTVTGGTPSLDVTIGSNVRSVPLSSGNNSDTLIFLYVVVGGDVDANGIEVNTSLNKNGASVTYGTGSVVSSLIDVPILTSVLVNGTAGNAPVAANITPAAFNEDTQSIITLSYTDTESDLATSCSLTSLVKVTVTQACACAAGVCTVGVTGTLNSNGAASFAYTVTANSQISNSATATLSITPVADLPVAANITPAAFNEDIQSIITLSYTDGDNDLATICAISAPTNVTVTQACACAAGVCTVGVTGTANYYGAASFNYTVTTNGQLSNSALATLSITSVNDAPVAANITPAAFNEDVQSIITLSYTDAESDLATVCAISSPTNVTVTQACACAAGVCTVGVTGTANYNGAASFAYTVTAAGGTSNSATATLSITAVDDAPIAANITPASFDTNTQSVITLSYTDVESHLATTCAISSPTNVTVTQACACAAGVCTVGVTSTFNYVGAASFNYTVTANGLASNSALASLTITNAAPVAANITPAAFNEDTQSVITLSYTDPNSDLATVCAISSPTNVTVTQACACAAGVCTVGVTGTLNYNGAASFAYTVTAGGDLSNSATATLSITAVDDAPVAANITPAAFNEDTQSIITLSYTDVDSDLATVCAISSPTNVTVTQACACAAGVCTVGVTGTTDYFGAASFGYTVTANSVVSNTATATLTILDVNDAPVASNITPAAFNEDVQSIITLSYTDAESDLATVCAISSPTSVTVTQACACAAGICTVGVTGTANYNGAASFSYTVTATGGVSNSATATLSITPVDDAPVAINITPASFYSNTQSVITLSYTDIETDLATTCAISSPTNVTVTQACACAAGVCTVGVTSTSNYSGAASFNYTVTANGLTSNSALASLTITNSPPVASNISPAAFNEDTQSVITLSYTDPESDLATVCAISSPTNVTVTQACACAAGICTVGVTGTLNYNGAASFAYTVTAVGGTSNSATATLSITPVPDAPVAINITPAAFNEDVSSTITLSYTDAEGDLATSCSTSGLTNITVTSACSCVVGTCTVGVRGTSNYFGTASFTYTVTANSQMSNTATASLTISSVEDAAVASNITPAAFNEDTQSIITLSYTDVDSQSTSCTLSALSNVTITQACACAAGVCTVGVTGTANYYGAASFNYIVASNSVNSNTATATLSITAVNDNPIIGAIGTQTGTMNANTGSIAFTITDVDNTLACSAARLSMTSSNTALVTNGSVAWSGTAPNCTAVITPVTDASGTTTITFTVNDGSGGSATSNFTLNINGVVFAWTTTGGTVITLHEFGTPGTNTTVDVLVKNIGNQTSGTITITDNGGSNRIGHTGSCTTLAAGATCPITITWTDSNPSGFKTETFTASATGAVSSTLTVTGTK